MSMIKIIAREIIENLDLSIPIDLNRICECYDIKILYRDIKGADGYFLPARKKIIVSNNIKGSYKERFTIAHELGHYFNENDRTYDLDSYKYNDFSIKQSDLEKEADEFASELLMPDKYIKQEIENIDIKDWELLIDLALKYKVSVAAILIKFIDNSYGINKIAYFYNNKLIWQYGNNFKYNVNKNQLNGNEVLDKYQRKFNSEWIDGDYNYTDEVLIDKGNIKYLLLSVDIDELY